MANIAKTYTLVNGQPADATQVNKNFDDIINGVGDATTLRPTIASLGLDADLTTLALPANTTISAAGAELINDADATAQRATLGLSIMWPVGSVFTSVVATNPNTLLGFGTWGSIAAGRVLVGLDSGDASFDAVKETGGAKTVQASAQSFAGSQVTTSFQNGASQSFTLGGTSAVAFTHTHTVTAAGTNAPGAATSVVQPYFVVYFWERTA